MSQKSKVYFPAVAPRLAGVCLRVQEGAIDHALAFFNRLGWIELSDCNLPVRNARFVSVAQTGFPVLALIERPDVDFGETSSWETFIISVRNPLKALVDIDDWAKSNGLFVSPMAVNKQSALFVLDEVFTAQILLVP